MFPSDSPVHMLKRYNAVYAGNDSDLPAHFSRLIPAPDQCSSIFSSLSHEGRATEHDPEGIQANPSMPRKRRSQRSMTSFFRTRGSRLTLRGKAVIDRRIGAPATPG